MNNYTTDLYEVKREFVNFSKRMSEGLDKPSSKFMMDMIYGISKGKSLLVSEISRALDEKIKLINTEARLCDNLYNFSDREKEIVMNNYHNEMKELFPELPICIFDDTDIAKRYGKKFEDLCMVRDASSLKEEIVPGYHVCEAVALTNTKKQPISLYSKIYSTKSKGFESTNRITIESINTVRNVFKRPIIGVFDRGYDAEEFYKEFFGSDDKFIIRMKDRYLMFKDKRRKAMSVAKERKGKIRMILMFEAEEVDVSISYTKVRLPKHEEELQLITVYGLSDEEPLMLLTNMLENDKKSIMKIVRLYMYRWRVEEYFRVKKQEYDFENMRVRSLQSMNALNLMITLVMGYNAKLIEAMDKKLLTIKIIERSKSFKNKICTWLYQIARGIEAILAHAKVGIKEFQKVELRKQNIQLSLRL
jgi:hypothetical protein